MHLPGDESSTCVCLRLREQCLRSEITSVARVAHVLLLSFVAGKAGHRSNVASLRFRVNAATERRNHTQVDFLWITQRFRTIAVFPINWVRLDASVFTSMLPATKRKSRTFVTRETDVISERNHCSRRRRHTQVELSSSRKCADKTQTIALKRWHGARKRKRSNVRSTCGRLYMDVNAPASKRKHNDCSKAPRNPHKVNLCVLASFSCRVYAE